VSYEIVIQLLKFAALKYEDIGLFGFLLVLFLPFVLSSINMYLLALWLEDDYLKNNFGKINIFGLVFVLILLIIFDLIANMNMGKNIFGVFQHAKTFADLNTSDGWAQRGQWGDILSGHFSALAFIALALSIYIQGKTLKVQQEELDRQKEELRLQRNHDTFKTIMEMIGSVELAIEKKGVMVGADKLDGIGKINSYLRKNKKYIPEIIIACGNDIIELESSNKAIRTLSVDSSKEQKEVINIKMQKFVATNRMLASALVLNQVFRYFESNTDDKETIFTNIFFSRNSTFIKELMVKAEELAKKVELENSANPKDDVLMHFGTKDGISKEIMRIADKYSGVR